MTTISQSQFHFHSSFCNLIKQGKQQHTTIGSHTRCSCFERPLDQSSLNALRSPHSLSCSRSFLCSLSLQCSLSLSLSCANNINLATMRRSHDRAKAAVAVVLSNASSRLSPQRRALAFVGTVPMYRAAPLRRRCRHATHYHNHASVRCPLPTVRCPPNVQGHGLCGACPPFACAQVRITAREGGMGS